MSAPSCWVWKSKLLETEDCRDLCERNAGGDAILGDPSGDGDRREENRRSNGCRDGRWARKELCDAGTLLPGDDNMEPFRC